MISNVEFSKPENALIRRYLYETVKFDSYRPKDVILVHCLMMETGGQSIMMQTALTECLRRNFPGKTSRVICMTADEIRQRNWKPSDLVDWLLKSHIHIIGKSLMMSFVKDAQITGNRLREWVKIAIYPEFTMI